MVSFGTRSTVANGGHHGGVLGDAAGLYFLPTMKPVMFCRKISGMPRWPQSSTKCAPFRADSENRMPLLATIPTDSRKDAQSRRPGFLRNAA